MLFREVLIHTFAEYLCRKITHRHIRVGTTKNGPREAFSKVYVLPLTTAGAGGGVSSFQSQFAQEKEKAPLQFSRLNARRLEKGAAHLQTLQARSTRAMVHAQRPSSVPTALVTVRGLA